MHANMKVLVGFVIQFGNNALTPRNGGFPIPNIGIFGQDTHNKAKPHGCQKLCALTAMFFQRGLGRYPVFFIGTIWRRVANARSQN